MLRYIKAAFRVRPQIRGLGRIPVNVLAVACCAILGFGHPAFWLLGLGLETAFLAVIATNKRFQVLVDAETRGASETDAAAQRRALAAQLTSPTRMRLERLEAKCSQAIELPRGHGDEEVIFGANRDALSKLSWYYLRLLLSQQYLVSDDAQATEKELRNQVTVIQSDLSGNALSPSIRQSKVATLQILKKRLENLERREQALAEIDADLTRIEAQVDLAVDNASMSTDPQAISANISLASGLLDPELFGPSQPAVADLDAAYGRYDESRERA